MGVTAKEDGSVEITYNITESGGSALVEAKIVAVRDGTTALADQRAVLNATTSGTAIVASPNLVGTNAYTFPNNVLDNYGRYLFYVACRDNQGWFNSPPGSATVINSPGTVSGTAIGNNGGRVFDPVKPVIIVSDVRALPDGKLRVVYSLTESGNSMLNAARIVASTSAMTREQVLASASLSSVDVVVANTATVSVINSVVHIANLDPWTAYSVYCAAKDNQGWYDNGYMSGGNAISRAIGNNGGRTWDQTQPTISISKMEFIDPGNSNALRVTVAISDGGGSGINRAGVFLRESAGSNTAISQHDILFGSGSGVRAAINSSHDFANLKEYTQYHAYAAVLDNQGNYNGSAATAHATTFDAVQNPLSVTGTAIPNNGRTYDVTKPAMSITNAQAQTDGSVVVTYTMTESGGSGLQAAKIFATTSSGALSPSSILAQTNNAVAVSSQGSGQTATFAGLNEYTQYYFFAAAKDNQGWFSSSTSFAAEGSVSGYAIQNNGGRTYDVTKPAMSITNAQAQTDGSVVFTYTLTESGGSGLQAAKIFATTSSGALSPSSILAQTTNAVAVSSLGSGQTATFAGLDQYTQYYFFAAAKDNQGWFSSSTSFAAEGSVSGYAIQNNGGRTWDRTAPTLDTDPTMALASGTSVTIAYSGASDPFSGLKHVKLMLTTSSAAFTNTAIESAADSGNTQRVTTSTAASGTATISGIQTGATVYGWAVSVDNAGNVSNAQRTSPQSIALDNIAPTASWVSGSQDTATTATITISVADNLTGITSGTIFVRRTGTSTDDYTSSISLGPGDQTFSVTNLQNFTDYTVFVTATDGAGNTLPITAVKTFKSWDNISPTWNLTPTVTNDDDYATISYNVSDTGSGLRSITSSGDASGSQALSGASASGSFTPSGSLVYGSNTISLTVTDRASDHNGSYLSSKADNKATHANITITVEPYGINPGPYVPSQYATVSDFALKSPLFYQSQIQNRGGNLGVITTPRIKTSKFWNLQGNFMSYLSSAFKPPGPFRILSVDFYTTDTGYYSPSQSAKFFTLRIYPGGAGHGIQLNALYRSDRPDINIMTEGNYGKLDMKTSATSNLYRYEITIVDAHICTFTIYDIYDNLKVLARKSLNFFYDPNKRETQNLVAQVWMENSTGSGNFIFGNIKW